MLALNGILTARWLGAAERGVVVIAASIAGGLLLLGGLGLVNSARKVIPDPEFEIDFGSFMFCAAKISLATAPAVALVAATLLTILANVCLAATVTIFSLGCCLLLYSAILREALHGAGRHVAAVTGDLSNAAVQLVGALALHRTGLLSADAMIALMTLGAMLQIAHGLIVGLDSNTRSTAPRRTTMSTLTILRYSLPGIGLTLGQWVALRSDRLILGAVAGVPEAGVYGAVATMAEAPWLVAAAISPILGTQMARDRDHEILRYWWRRAMTLTAVTSICATAAGAFIVVDVLGPEFRGGLPALIVLAPAAILLGSSQLDMAACLALKDLAAVSRITTAGAIVLASTAVPLSYLYGATGCALASLGSYALMAILARTTVRRSLSDLAR